MVTDRLKKENLVFTVRDGFVTFQHSGKRHKIKESDTNALNEILGLKPMVVVAPSSPKKKFEKINRVFETDPCDICKNIAAVGVTGVSNGEVTHESYCLKCYNRLHKGKYGKQLTF